MQFKRVLPASDSVALKKTPYQHRTPASVQKQHIKEFENSGLKQVEFCEQHNIPYSTFTNWWRRHRSDKAIVREVAVHDSSMITTTQEGDTTHGIKPIIHMTCTFSNKLSVVLSSIVLADLPKLIEVLSTCKLN